VRYGEASEWSDLKRCGMENDNPFRAIAPPFIREVLSWTNVQPIGRGPMATYSVPEIAVVVYQLPKPEEKK